MGHELARVRLAHTFFDLCDEAQALNGVFDRRVLRQRAKRLDGPLLFCCFHLHDSTIVRTCVDFLSSAQRRISGRRQLLLLAHGRYSRLIRRPIACSHSSRAMVLGQVSFSQAVARFADPSAVDGSRRHKHAIRGIGGGRQFRARRASRQTVAWLLGRHARLRAKPHHPITTSPHHDITPSLNHTTDHQRTVGYLIPNCSR